MMKKSKKLLSLGVNLLLIAFLFVFSPSLMVEQIKISPQEAEIAADQIVQDSQKDAPKAKFTQKESGSELIDNARENARMKLKMFAKEAPNSPDSPRTEVLQRPLN